MYVETADDLNRKYQRSWALLKNEVVYFLIFAQTAATITAAYTLGGLKDIQNVVNPEDIQPLSFDSMFVNNTNLGEKTRAGWEVAALLFKRRPIRQWKRGLCSENTQLTCPASLLFGRFGKQVGKQQRVLSFELINRMRDPTYPAFNEAIDHLRNHVAVAISPLFAVCLSSISPDKYLIASKYGFIGECAHNQIWILHPPSQQEITDYITRTKQANIKIEVGTCPPV